jgi:membrane associated rhomboid family serine protease
MAFRSNGPIMLALPAFRGVTRRIILIALASFVVCAILGLAAPSLEGTVIGLLVLNPETALHRLIWQFFSYPFIQGGLLSTAFALLTIWFFGSAVEDDRGSRWLSEFLGVATVGGGVLASLLSLAAGDRLAGLNPALVATNGMWPAALALLLAYGIFHAEETISFNFLFQMKAKYLVAIYLLFYLGSALIGADRFGALTALCNALCGYGYLRLAPRRGVRAGASEQWFGLRNAYYRSKRRSAAKKFAVYMRKQGKESSVDESGRYVDPDGKPRDPNDRSWMN